MPTPSQAWGLNLEMPVFNDSGNSSLAQEGVESRQEAPKTYESSGQPHKGEPWAYKT